jgi:ABC-type transport system involved in multi-copper enzyme maturation permease subunit
VKTLRKIFGILVISLRAALRAKTVFAFLVLLAVCVTLLPAVVKGDGTPEGDCRILLMYTIGFAFAILCLATLWAACALFAAEIDNQNIQLSAVKPVRAFEFWLGKWLALLVLNGLLVMAVYGAVYAQICWKQRQPGWRESVQLVSRHIARPLLPTPREEALETYAVLAKQKALPEGFSKAQVLRTLADKAQERYTIVNPGESVEWRFALARPIATNEVVTVRIRFDTEYSTRTSVAGLCRLGPDVPGAPAIEIPLSDFSLNEIVFDVSCQVFGATKDISGFNLGFTHTGDPAKTSAVMLRFRKDVALLTQGGTFEANLVRSAIIHWSILALLASFGLTLSACFSLPVAVFASTLLLLLVMVGTSVTEVVSQEDEKEWLQRPGIIVSRVVSNVAQHAIRMDPLDAVINGERIENKPFMDALLWNLFVAPFFFALCGILILRHRELASGD